MKTRITSLLLLLFASFSANAQIIDFDALAIASDSTQDTAVWNGYVGASFDIEKQRNQLIYLRLESTVSYEKKRSLLVLTANNKSTFSGEDQVQNTGSGRLKYLFNFRKRLFPEAFAQLQYDAQRGLLQRNVVGSNGVWTAINKKGHQLFLHLGLMYEEELWNYTAVRPENLNGLTGKGTELMKTVKINFNPRYVFKINDNSTFSAIIYAQARADSYIVYPRISPTVRINIFIVGNLLLSSGLSGIYDFRPIVPIDNFYYTWNNSLVWRF